MGKTHDSIHKNKTIRELINDGFVDTKIEALLCEKYEKYKVFRVIAYL